jgi:hypothetical protein
MKTRSSGTREAAEMLAIQALGYLAEEPERLAAFLSASGIAAEDIRGAAGDPAFLQGVLDHMLGDEQLLIGFADSAGIDPADIGKARRALGQLWERDVP